MTGTLVQQLSSPMGMLQTHLIDLSNIGLSKLHSNKCTWDYFQPGINTGSGEAAGEQKIKITWKCFLQLCLQQGSVIQKHCY